MGQLDNKTILFSGVFEGYEREDLEQKATAAGAKVLSGVTKKLNYLVAGEKMGPTKLQKANELNVPVITLADFWNLLGGKQEASAQPASATVKPEQLAADSQPAQQIVKVTLPVIDKPAPVPYILIPYLKGDKWGYATPEGEIVIDCIYDDISGSKRYASVPDVVLEGTTHICVRKGGKLGWIDIAGKEVIPFEYDQAITYTNAELLPVKKGEFWGAINMQGQEVVPFKYNRVGQLKHGVAVVELKGKYGAVNSKGEFILPLQYKFLFTFENEVTCAQLKKTYFLINTKGERVGADEYAESVYFSGEEFANATKDKKKYGLINTKGETIVPFEYSDMDIVDEYGWIKVEGKRIAGFISIDKPVPAKLQYPSVYQNMSGFSDGLAIVVGKKKGRIGYVNREGEEVIPIVYPGGGEFSEGLATFSNGVTGIAYDLNGKSRWKTRAGYMNKKGSEVIMLQYVDAQNFKEGLAAVGDGKGRMGYINMQGREVIPLKYMIAFSFENGFAKVNASEQLAYMIDKNGNEFYKP